MVMDFRKGYKSYGKLRIWPSVVIWHPALQNKSFVIYTGQITKLKIALETLRLVLKPSNMAAYNTPLFKQR